MEQKATEDLDRVLEQTGPEGIDDYLDKYGEDLVAGQNPFTAYIKAILKEKGISQQHVFRNAGMSEKYGYRILSQEKNTRQRDYILRICFAAGLSLKQTQRALKLYGMSELYSKVPRDAVLIIALDRGICDISKVNELLKAHDMEPLRSSQLDL